MFRQPTKALQMFEQGDSLNRQNGCLTYFNKLYSKMRVFVLTRENAYL